MSEKLKTAETAITAKTFAYRNIKKTFNEPEELPETSLQFHLELGENNQAVIVQDRDVDWVELANKDIDQVGLKNILALAAKRGDSLSRFAFNDSEALDLGELDPMNPNAVNESIKAGDNAQAKLDSIAKQFGITTEELIKTYIAGNLESLVKKGEEPHEN